MVGLLRGSWARRVLVGPYYQPLGEFTGERPSRGRSWRIAPRCIVRFMPACARCRPFTCALEPLNRFEALSAQYERARRVLCRSVSARTASASSTIRFTRTYRGEGSRWPGLRALSMKAGAAAAHVHISENDRGTPGRGHAAIRETIRELKALGYDGWLTIEAFGRARARTGGSDESVARFLCQSGRGLHRGLCLHSQVLGRELDHKPGKEVMPFSCCLDPRHRERRFLLNVEMSHAG